MFGLTGLTDLDRSYAFDGRLKLLLGPDGLAGCFDLGRDPLEREDVSADDAYRARLRELERGLLEWREETVAAGIVAGRQSNQNFDASTREQLKALGYIE